MDMTAAYLQWLSVWKRKSARRWGGRAPRQHSQAAQCPSVAGADVGWIWVGLGGVHLCDLRAPSMFAAQLCQP